MIAESLPTYCAVIVKCTTRGHDAQNAVGYSCDSARPSIFNCVWKPLGLVFNIQYKLTPKKKKNLLYNDNNILKRHTFPKKKKEEKKRRKKLKTKEKKEKITKKGSKRFTISTPVHHEMEK